MNMGNSINAKINALIHTQYTNIDDPYLSPWQCRMPLLVPTPTPAKYTRTNAIRAYGYTRIGIANIGRTPRKTGSPPPQCCSSRWV